MMRAWSVGLAFCLLLVGCGGGGSSPAPAGPGSVQLSATYDPSLGEITLKWTPLAGSIDGYNLEARIGSGAYSQVNQTLIPNQVTSAILTFTSGPPELAILDFRMNAVWKGATGPYSNVVELPIPVTPPTTLSAAYDSTGGGIRVSWWTASQIADHIFLERAPCDAAGYPTGPWSSLPLPAPLSVSILDTGVAESQGYIYRVSAWVGTISSSVTGPSLPVFLPPLAPTSFSAQSLPGAVGLSWVNQSKTTNQIQVIRHVPGVVGTTIVLATLPPTATTFQDAGLSLGYYGYNLTVSDGRSTIASPEILAAPVNPPGSLALATSALSSNLDMSTSALSSGGLWAFGTYAPFAVLPASWGSWPTWSPASMFSHPSEFLQLDAQSRPHILYQNQTAAVDFLTHDWFDGSTWNTEVVQQMPAPSAVLATSFGLDKTDTPQVLQDAGPGGTLAGLVYSRKVAGTWAHETLDPSASTTTFTGTPTFFLDASDAPHVLVTSWSSTQAPTREYTRNPDGTWTSQILPNTQTAGGFYYFEDGVWAGANTAWVVYQSPDTSNPSTDGFWVVRKVAGTWQQPVLLKSFLHAGTPLDAITLSPDGTRVAAICNTTNGLFLYTWTAAQGWVETLLPILPYALVSPYLRTAFDGANHLHILVKPSVYSGNLVDLHE